MSERIKWIDLSKGIAIILVVIGHTFPENSYLWNFIFSFHMPFFFIIAGFLYSPKLFKTSIINNAQRLLLPYFATCIAYALLILIKLRHVPLLENIRNSIVATLYGTGSTPIQFPYIGEMGAIWFLLAMFFANIIFNYIMNKTNKSKYMQAIIIFILSIAGYIVGQNIYLPWSIDISLVSLLFMYIGYMLKYTKFFQRKPNLFIIFVLFSIWGLSIYNGGLNINTRTYNNPLISIIGSVGGSIFLIYLSITISKFEFIEKGLSYVGKETLTILCIHLLEGKCFPWEKILHYEILYSNAIMLSIFKIIVILAICTRVKNVPFIRSMYYYKQYPLKSKNIVNLSR